MAVSINEFARRWNNLKSFVVSDIDRIADDNSALIEEMQRKRLSKGKNIEGKTIQRGYSPGYAKRRKKKGLQTNYVDLNFTGEFYESLELTETNPGEYTTISYAEHAKYILDKYIGVLGLDKEDSKKLKGLMLIELNNSIKRYLVG